MDVSQCQLLRRLVRAKQHLRQDSSSDHQQHLLAERISGTLLGLDQGRGVLGSCRENVLITYEGRWPGDTASIGPSKRVQQSQVALTDIYIGTKECFSERGGIAKYQVSEFQTCFVRTLTV